MVTVPRPAQRLSLMSAALVVLMAIAHMAGHLRTREPRTPDEATLDTLMRTIEFSFLGGRFTMQDARATLNIFYFAFAVLAALMIVVAMPALRAHRAAFTRVHILFAIALLAAGVGSMLRGFTMPGPVFIFGAILCIAAAAWPVRAPASR